jgi:hypothetical protein
MAVNYQNKIVTSGLVLCLDASDKKSYPGTGTTWYDRSGNGYHGTLSGSTIDNNNLIFDGLSQVELNSPVVNSTFTELTVEVFFKTTTSRTELILENGNNYLYNSFYLAKENTTELTFEIFGPTYDARFCSIPYALNQWYHFVGTWKSGERADVYLNGVKANGASIGSIIPSLINGNTNFFIGRRPGTASYNFNGQIPIVKVYNRKLSDKEIQQNFNATRGRFGI